MKIAVIFFGIVRNIEVTIQNIKQNVYVCNAGADLSFHIFASLNIVSVLNNPRSGEVGVSLDAKQAFLLDADLYLLARQDDVNIIEELAAAQRQHDVFHDRWVSVKNLLHQLTSLRRAWVASTKLENGHYDYFLFLRPDLLFLDQINIRELISSFRGNGNVALPAWNSFKGFNDRFAFTDKTGGQSYAERIKLVSKYCKDYPLHPESFLAYALDRGACRVCNLPVRAQRVRVTGKIVQEDFGAWVTEIPRDSTRFSLSSKGVNFILDEPSIIGPKMESSNMNPSNQVTAPPSGSLTRASASNSDRTVYEIELPIIAIRRIETNGQSRVSSLGGLQYLEFLKQLHVKRRVERYLEIGTQYGMSLNCAVDRAIAIDPNFLLDKDVWSAKPGIKLYESTSDEFFEMHNPKWILGGPIDLAFIDGMHLSEFVLRDFINVERYCGAESLIVLHDVIPQNFEMTERERRTDLRQDKALAAAWTGDVWRVVPLLMRERPDLIIKVLDCPPTGLVLISHLNPQYANSCMEALPSTLTEVAQSEAEFWSYINSVTVYSSNGVT